MLYRYTGSTDGSGAALSEFEDAADISGFAQDAMRWAVAEGIMDGNANGVLKPTDSATRAEAAQMMTDYFKRQADRKPYCGGN